MPWAFQTDSSGIHSHRRVFKTIIKIIFHPITEIQPACVALLPFALFSLKRLNSKKRKSLHIKSSIAWRYPLGQCLCDSVSRNQEEDDVVDNFVYFVSGWWVSSVWTCAHAEGVQGWWHQEDSCGYVGVGGGLDHEPDSAVLSDLHDFLVADGHDDRVCGCFELQAGIPAVPERRHLRGGSQHRSKLRNLQPIKHSLIDDHPNHDSQRHHTQHLNLSHIQVRHLRPTYAILLLIERVLNLHPTVGKPTVHATPAQSAIKIQFRYKDDLVDVVLCAFHANRGTDFCMWVGFQLLLGKGVVWVGILGTEYDFGWSQWRLYRVVRVCAVDSVDWRVSHLLVLQEVQLQCRADQLVGIYLVEHWHQSHQPDRPHEECQQSALHDETRFI